ncbi:OmpA family protein [Rubellimicrobium aerolatum]|uniref:OmpA family protein n=1 Tax=Rubellimicrobium aerolatum TaxID=490979 RepID=A0ABW0SFR6_9RHOB|nr:OmpA family protein [Rubellimicrobium aerolatum]MBP1807210.1 OOP family OmpA-OmpF porin [Rubellimicrobium aerolatum]
MKLSPPLLAAAAFLCAGGLSAVAAQSLARLVEDRSVQAVADRLRTEGQGWASVLGDGLQVVLEGEAPTEADRFNAISAAGSAVDPSRVIDNLHVAEAEPLAPPDFAIELLRNDAGVSLVGLIPADTDRERLTDDVREAASGQDVADLLQSGDYPVPEGWDLALDYALDALEELPRAKISVAPGRVGIDAITDSPEEQKRLTALLARLKPEGLRLGLSVSAPRPVIAPFTVRARLEGGRLAFDACSADSEESRGTILAAALAAGAERPLDCRLGLGAPTPDWGPAVAAGLAALHDLGGGTLTFSDADVSLVAPEGTDRALFDRVAGELDGALPDVFALDAQRPVPVAEAPQGPPEFTATLDAEGRVRLSGRIEDARMTGLARAFAQARFGAGDVTLATRPGAEGLPPGWSMRVLAGIEALSRLHDGRVTVTPDALAVSGRTGDAAAREEIAARAIETLGPGARLDIAVAYDEALDPLAALPTPEECLAEITAVTDAAKITFDPGSATLSRQGAPVIDAIAGILRSCPDLRLRISGYTDSQGRESSNLSLSQGRAEAVLAALRAQRVPVAGFEAQGFGEASPLASNETEAGREANRRIEFSLIGVPAPAAPLAPGAEPPHDATAQPMAEAPDTPPVRPGTEPPAETATAPEPAEAVTVEPPPPGPPRLVAAPALPVVPEATVPVAPAILATLPVPQAPRPGPLRSETAPPPVDAAPASGDDGADADR